MRIEGRSPIDIVAPEATRKAPAGKDDFGKALMGALSEVRGAENQAADLAQKFSDGDPNVAIHHVMIASEKASISLRYATTLKNKMLEAYRDLINTPI